VPGLDARLIYMGKDKSGEQSDVSHSPIGVADQLEVRMQVVRAQTLHG